MSNSEKGLEALRPELVLQMTSLRVLSYLN